MRRLVSIAASLLLLLAAAVARPEAADVVPANSSRLALASVSERGAAPEATVTHGGAALAAHDEVSGEAGVGDPDAAHDGDDHSCGPPAHLVAHGVEESRNEAVPEILRDRGPPARV